MEAFISKQRHRIASVHRFQKSYNKNFKLLTLDRSSKVVNSFKAGKNNNLTSLILIVESSQFAFRSYLKLQNLFNIFHILMIRS